MKTKSFQEYLEKRLSEDEIREIEQQAHLEVSILQTLQKDIANAIDAYMQKTNIGFNELVRRLNSSPTQLAKIQKGDANLTLASLAHIFALIGQEPHLIFKTKTLKEKL